MAGKQTWQDNPDLRRYFLHVGSLQDAYRCISFAVDTFKRMDETMPKDKRGDLGWHVACAVNRLVNAARALGLDASEEEVLTGPAPQKNDNESLDPAD